MATHHFHLQADWPGGRNAVGSIHAGNLQTEISIPPEMDGPGVGTNPDEMLLGAASTCYIITLGAMIERAELPLANMDLKSEGIVDVTNGVFTYKKIIHRPTVLLKSGSTDADIIKTKQLVEKAEQSCMISRAVMGNVELQLEAEVSIVS
ncbi:OsmC family protein [Sediminibacillus albus]|uniref:Peroxiredoxin, SACOL1771 subfamily n=1 Tax=Sediminibacillus albus TaxID=407036 RepID=A0A1G8ZP66_9BACI|nr:OsmC family protein [Sediminibacillus albus]SDK16896.1 peroxiredoxin, SACOL1771 subfamily [Sediminibacillus albus]